MSSLWILYFSRILGKKRYELTNHLGNVMVTISDKKTAVSSNPFIADYYLPDIKSAQDFYPFGAVMPKRNFSLSSYRYSFQGQERDDEWAGTSNIYAFKYRMHDPRTGRFLSIDPLLRKYPWNSLYAFSENKLGLGVELEGLELQELYSSMYKYNYIGSIPNRSGETKSVYSTDIIKRNVPPGYKEEPHLVVGTEGRDEYNPNPIWKEPERIKQPDGPPEQEDKENSKSDAAKKGADGIMLILDVWEGFKKFLFNVNVRQPEVIDRYTYYSAYSIANEYREKGLLKNYKEFTKGQGFADLVNYINDGSLPTDREDITKEYLDHLQYVGNTIFEKEGIENKRLSGKKPILFYNKSGSKE